jgi:hypothetical protein
MPTPSLILVPARFKTGKLYTPVATTSGGVVLGASGDFNVTRATTATRVNANGLIESVASGIPRLDYYTSGGTAGCPALLVEPQAQNIMAQSETLSVSGNWTQENIIVSGGAIASPDGLASGTLIVATASSTTHSLYRFPATSIASGATITTSCFFKAHGTNTFVQMWIGVINFSPASPFANFNLTGSGSVTAGNYSSAFIQNYGNGWYRCGFTTTASASGTPLFVIVPILASGTSRNPTFTGDGVNGVYAWGFQVETGSIATSYIPTTTAAVTRNADVISVTGAVSGCVGQTEGTIYAEVDSRNQQTGRIVSFQIAGTAGSGQIRIDTVGASLRCRLINASGTSVFDVTSSPAMSLGINKMAFAFNAAASGIVVALNGSIIATATAGASTVHNATQLTIGAQDSVAGFGSFYNDRIRAVAIYSTRLTNAELQSLTTL